MSHYPVRHPWFGDYKVVLDLTTRGVSKFVGVTTPFIINPSCRDEDEFIG